MIRMMATVMACLGFVATAWAEVSTTRRAVELFDAGRLGEAQVMLESLAERDPQNGEVQERLGDVYRKQGQGEAAERAYRRAVDLGRSSVGLWNNLATVQTWNRQFSAAQQSYRKALEINPDDREALEGLDSVRRKRGLTVFGAIGPWEADTAVKGWRARDAEIFYGGFDRLDLYAGASTADKLYYQRTSVYGKAYWFVTPGRYLKVRLGQQVYSYPEGGVFPQPDANAYDQVPKIEIEGGERRGPWDVAVTYEYFRPNFFWDSSTRANNHKLSAEVGYRLADSPLRVVVLPGVLRDPDPEKTRIDTVAGRVTELVYNTQWLFGAGAAWSGPRLQARGIVLQNRDLDQSYAYSLLALAEIPVTGTVSVRLDYIYDVYSRHSIFDGEVAHLSTFTLAWAVTPAVEVSAGPKLIVRPTGRTGAGVDRETETGGFVTLRLRFAL